MDTELEQHEQNISITLNGLTLADEFDGIPVSRDWLMQTLSSTLLSAENGPTNLRSIKCVRVDKGQGFTSFIGKVTMDWTTNGHQLPKSIVIKLPTVAKIDDEMDKLNNDVTDEQKQKLAENLQKIDFTAFLLTLHRNERFIYKFFADQKIPVPFPVLRFYGSEDCDPKIQKTGYLLFEDLTETAQTSNAMKGLNEAQCREVVASIAALQAYGIVNQCWNDGSLKGTGMEKMMQVEFAAQGIRKFFSDTFTTTDDQLNTILNAAMNCQMFNASQQVEDGKIYPVLVHGDLWCNNILFHTDKSGSLTDSLAALIDWQLAHPGPCAEDLVRVIVLSLNPDVRKRIEMDLLKFYFHMLKQNLDRSGVAVPFSFEEVVASYRNNFSAAAITLLMVTNMFLMKINQKPEPDQEDSEELKQTIVERLVAALQQAYEYAVEDAVLS